MKSFAWLGRVARQIPILFATACVTVLPSQATTSSPPRLSVKVVAEASIDSLLAAVRREYPVPALAAAAVRENTLSVGALGERRMGSADPVRTSDRFHIGSLAKSVTASLMGSLVEEGVLSWSRTPAEVWPEWISRMHPAAATITLEQLLSNTAGLSSFNPGDPQLDGVPAMEGTAATQRAVFARWLLGQELVAAPGAQFQYSNAGYSLAAAMAERATGKAWETLVQEHVFDRLGLATAGFGWPAAMDPAQPWGHEEDEEGFQPHDPLGEYHLPIFLAPAGDLHMSVEDLARYAQAHMAGLQRRSTWLRQETLRKLHTPIAARSDHPSYAGTAYAFGWNVRPAAAAPGEGMSYHTGGTGTFIAEVRIDPRRDFATVVITNAGGVTAARALSRLRSEMEARFASNGQDGFVAGIAPPVHATVVSGIVRFDGHPLPGVFVAMRSPDETRKQVTEADGRYRLECPFEASCTLTATMAGFESVSREICLPAIPVELDLHMNLSPVSDYLLCVGRTPMPTPVEKSIRGMVRDELRKPVSKAVIWIDEEPYWGCQGSEGEWERREMIPGKRTTVETDEHGEFSATLPVVSAIRVTASAPGRQPDHRKLDRATDREPTLVLLPDCSGTPLE
jgi:CubicO group peptidase (beta-lactamase class C family)